MKQRSQHILILSFLLLIEFNSSSKTFASSGTVKAKETHQTLIGFGAAIAWTEATLTANLAKTEIYDYIFNDLGLDILRLKNSYRNGQVNNSTSITEIVENMYALSPVRPKILICSWTPPADLKSNNAENGGNNSNATLKKVNNQYVYRDFANYWVNAINAYKNLGAEPDYISIQNEPSYDASWESCRFDPTETTTIAGYGKALDTVYDALQKAGLQTKLIAAEAHGIGYNTFQNYAAGFKRSIIDGYAYHLYHGDDGSGTSASIRPDAFNTNLSTVGRTYTDKPIWQTEFDRGDWLQTAWLIQNSLVNGNVAAYLWWQLVWGSGGKPLIEVGFSTYSISQYYWMFRQFSKYTDPGWKRITVTDDADSLRLSAFVNPEGTNVTVIAVNIGTKNDSLTFTFQDFSVTGGIAVRTTATEKGVEISSSYDGTSYISTPGRSITTIAFTGTTTNAVEEGSSHPSEFSLSQNYPNPFNPATTIEYTLARESHVQLKVYDILGRLVTTLVQEKMSAGKHTVQFDATNLQSGVYFYTISGGDGTLSKKMLVVK